MFIVQTYIIFQGKSEWKKLKYGPPECLEQLQQMFAHTAVDGSTSCIARENNGDEGKVYGDLTIKGITKPVVLNVENGGVVVDPYGQTKAGFTVTGKVSRKEFGLTWDGVTEAGSVVVGEDIKLTINAQLLKQK